MATPQEATRECSACGELKPLSEYYFDKKTGYYKPPCKPCERIRRKAWAKANPEKTKLEAQRRYRRRVERHGIEVLRAHNAAWKKANPDRVLKTARKTEYGLDDQSLQAMLDQQNNRCSICSRGITERTLVVDHNHNTGEVRGLLCRRCNIGIGYFEDNRDLLSMAIYYLSDPQLLRAMSASA